MRKCFCVVRVYVPLMLLQAKSPLYLYLTVYDNNLDSWMALDLL